jgi:hypothetical protein
MSNYTVVQGPNPASYGGNPNFGLQLGQMLGQLPDSYMQGRQFGQQRELEDMFKTEKLPRNKDGSVDVNNLIDRGAKTGGFPFVMKMLPFLQTGEIMNKVGQDQPPQIGGNSGGGPPFAPNMPASNNPRGQSIYTSSNGSGINDDKDAPTIRSIITKRAGEDVDSSKDIRTVGGQLGINPDDSLTPEGVKLVKGFLQTRDNTGTVTQGQNGRNAAPLPAGGVSGAPGPSQAQPNQPTTTPAQAQLGQQPTGGASPPWQRVAQAPAPSLPATGQGTGLPAGWNQPFADANQAYADRLSMYALAADRAGNKDAADKLKSRAAQYSDYAKQIREALAKNAELTPEAKKARESGVAGGPLGMEAAGKAQTAELARGDKLYNGIQRMAGSYENQLKPHLDLMRSILNDPHFVSGTGEGFLTALNRIRANPLFQSLPGYDPNAATPNEAIRKVMAAAILNQTTQMKEEGGESGSAGGRLFQQQIALMEKAAQDPHSTLPSLRLLTEIQTRMGEHDRAVAKFADNYAGKYGRGVLDNDFNRALSKFNDEHPIFKKDELDHMELIAPPVAPAHATAEEANKWAKDAGIRPGDPIKLQSGKIIPFQPLKITASPK